MSDRFQELILHLCRRSEDDTNFGATKLNKLLWFTDLAAFLRTGQTVTGQGYKKLPHGPVPIDYERTMEEMRTGSRIAMRVEDRYGYPQKRARALVEPDLTAFTGEEVALADEMIRHYWNLNGSEISDLSHACVGWQLAELGEDIPLQAGFVEQRPLESNERAYATNLTTLPEYMECHAN